MNERMRVAQIQRDEFDNPANNTGFGIGPMQDALIRFRQNHALRLFDQAELPILDIGTGNAEIHDHLNEHGNPAIGVDITLERIKWLKKTRQEASLFPAFAQELPFKNESIGGVCAFEVIEHMTYGDGTIMLQEAFRVLAPGGYLILSTVNRDAFSVSKMLGIYTQTETTSRVDHIYEYSYSEWEGLLTQTGFTNTDIQGIGIFPPMWKLQEFIPSRTIQDLNLKAAAAFPNFSAETLVIGQKPQ